jgi:predicted nucleic acid-binding protein
MILVVADTTPLRYLVEIGYEHLLPKLFTKVWIPGAGRWRVATRTRARRRSTLG